MYNQDFDKLIKQTQGQQFLEDFKETYYYEKLRNVVSENNIYVRDYVKSKPKYRITFPFFLLCVLLINIFAAVKWLFTGSLEIDEKGWIGRKLIAWDKTCNFKIVA